MTVTETQLTLYACPIACSLVSHIALEMAGADFQVRFIDLFAGAHKQPDYVALNPRSKVPLLDTGEERISENVAILAWLTRRYPEARLLPDLASDAGPRTLSHLGWFASGIHPLISRVVVPDRFGGAGPCADSVKEIAADGLAAEFALIDRMLAGREWWLDAPSALDAYIFWFWARVGEAPFDRAPYEQYAAHAARMLQMPPVLRALRREREFRHCYTSLGA